MLRKSERKTTKIYLIADAAIWLDYKYFDPTNNNGHNNISMKSETYPVVKNMTSSFFNQDSNTRVTVILTR